MKTIKEALEFLEAQPDIEKYLADRGMLNLSNREATRCYTCPVAQYLQAETGLDDCWVGATVAAADQLAPDCTRLTERVVAFIERFDKAVP